MGRARHSAYLGYSLPRSELVDRVESSLRRAGFRVVDPYAEAGVGTSAEIGLRDLELIAGCDVVVGVFQREDDLGVSDLCAELGFGFALRKKVIIVSNLDLEDYPVLKAMAEIKSPSELAPIHLELKLIKCYHCGAEFTPWELCPKCDAFICPKCGGCECNLNPCCRRVVQALEETRCRFCYYDFARY